MVGDGASHIPAKCSRCGELSDELDSAQYPFALFFWFLGLARPEKQLCPDCAGFNRMMNMIMVVGVAVIVLVFAIV